MRMRMERNLNSCNEIVGEQLSGQWVQENLPHGKMWACIYTEESDGVENRETKSNECDIIKHG